MPLSVYWVLMYLFYFPSVHRATLINEEDHIFGDTWKVNWCEEMDKVATMFLVDTEHEYKKCKKKQREKYCNL